MAAGCGYEPKILQVGERFEDVVADWKPDIIVLDIIMPERDGFEMIGALGAAGYRGQIVLVSGAVERYLAMASRTAGDRGLSVSSTLRKPCRAEELRQALRKAAAAVQARSAEPD